MDPVIAFLLGTTVTAIGWVITHFLSKRRDRAARQETAQSAKDERKRHFLRFMAQWRSEVEQTVSVEKLVLDYRAKLHLFRAETAAIDYDFPRELWGRFDLLCMDMPDIEADEAQTGVAEDTRARISKALDAVVRFVEST